MFREYDIRGFVDQNFTELVLERTGKAFGTFLTSLTGPAGTAAPVAPTQQQSDDVLLDYLRNVYPLAEAQAQMAKLDANAKQLELRRG